MHVPVPVPTYICVFFYVKINTTVQVIQGTVPGTVRMMCMIFIYVYYVDSFSEEEKWNYYPILV